VRFQDCHQPLAQPCDAAQCPAQILPAVRRGAALLFEERLAVAPSQQRMPGRSHLALSQPVQLRHIELAHAPQQAGVVPPFGAATSCRNQASDGLQQRSAAPNLVPTRRGAGVCVPAIMWWQRRRRRGAPPLLPLDGTHVGLIHARRCLEGHLQDMPSPCLTARTTQSTQLLLVMQLQEALIGQPTEGSAHAAARHQFLDV
jgi:hypothetical protein